MSGQKLDTARTTWLDRIKGNPILAVIGAIMAAVILLAQCTKALDEDNLNVFCKKPVKAVADCYVHLTFCSGLSAANCELRKSQYPNPPGRPLCNAGCL
jgi:hypothetical protein